VEPEIDVTSRGTIPITDSAGSGYVPKMAVIDKVTVRKEVIRRSA